MERIEVWTTRRDDKGREIAQPLDEVQTTETEKRLEDLLVATPDLLLPGLRLIGRQVQTGGGPLDLLGVDADGRVVLFELKRGTLTRDAVAQILDYGSDLLERSADDFANLIETSSGRLGIDRIDDFAEWFSAEFPDVAEPDLESIAMVLVGLGVDERARRMVNFLATSGLDVRLLTFQAFQQGGETLIARKVETVEPKSVSRSKAGGKETNRAQLEELAIEQGVLDLLNTVNQFVSRQMPSAYVWPHKTAYGYSLSDQTEEGRPSLRSYGALWVDRKERGQLIFSLPERAIDAAADTVQEMVAGFKNARLTSSSWTPFELVVTEQNWESLQAPVADLIAKVLRGRDRLAAERDAVNDPAQTP